jgi:S1-C subfamily serine protease
MYSRGQVVFYIGSAVLIVSALFIGFGLVRPEWAGGEGGGSGEGTGAAGAVEENGGFELQSEPAPVGNVFEVDSAGSYSEDELRNIRVYDRFNRGVVNVTTETLSLNWFLEPVPREGGTGSGSIIDPRGYVLTNHHVVEGAYRVHITLYDGSQYEGTVEGADRENDLAVLKFDPGEKQLTTIPFGSSDDLRVGQHVLAIGNPFGYDRTLTTGIVSGLGRPVRTAERLVIRDMIQTDASINPGNSGGPLLDADGRMIGINTMIYSPSGGSVGIGFAVPVNTARRVVPELIEYGRVRRGWIEIFPVQLEPNIVRYGNLPVRRGIMVSEVKPEGNADQAGIRGGDRDRAVRYGRSVIYFGGDIIVGVDGSRVQSLSDLFAALEDNKPGETVDVTVVRGRGKRVTLEVELAERPENLQWE